MSLDNLPLYNSSEAVTTLQQDTETGQAIKELNNTSIDKDSKMSEIDLRSRLSNREVSAIMALDVLVSLGAFPKEALQLTTQRKRLAVSLHGKGREEIVKISSGVSEKANKGIRSIFGGNNA